MFEQETRPVNTVWGFFDRDRKHLEQQYINPVFDASTGLAPGELACAAEEYLKTHAGQSRVLQKANITRLILERGRIGVDPLDFFADKLQHGGIIRNIQERWNNEVKENILPDETAWMADAVSTGLLEGELDLGHTAAGWTHLLERGLLGLIDDARRCKAAHGNALTQDQSDFYESVEIVYTAIIQFADRLASLARQTAEASPAGAERLIMIAEALGNVPANPPRTLHEALQFTYFMHQIIEMEGEWLRSMGGFDRLYLPYYRSDMDSGRLNRAQAKELIKYFWTKFFAHTRGIANGKNFYFGGCLQNGSDAVNELSGLALEAYDELDTTDPKLSIRVGRNTPDTFLAQVLKIIRQGKTAFVLVNDDVAIPAIVKHGKTLEEARDYLLIGCYEPAIEGREIACNMSIKINMAKAVELALNSGADPVTGKAVGSATGDPQKMETFEEFMSAALAQMDNQVDRATEYVRRFERFWPEINPSPALAGTIADCLIKGRDIGQAGPKYNNTGCMGAGLANAADSLAAVKRLVYDEKRCTMAELLDALKNNFMGYEELHRYIVHRIPKWGNDEPEVDAIAKRLADHYTARVNATPNTRGGWFRASMFTLDYRYRFGKRMGATPDGRLAGVYIAGGVGAMTARDVKGITAQILSVTKLDYTDIPNGSVVDIYLHPSAVQGGDGLAAFLAMVRTYFRLGGYGIQFNVFDSQTLRDAQAHPEKYATLQVRVCGWNVYFTSMSPDEQEQYIEANKHLL